QRAQVMADAAGVTLGAATSITEQSVGNPTSQRDFDAAASDGGVPIEPGELELTVTVQVVFAID
ncbi:SIMPL domain-containing protein, partial [Candidatus Poribacteria bacterium]|nr:SIMPL domain-containing protein [Candidatus Poribacteria bacterium]